MNEKKTIPSRRNLTPEEINKRREIVAYYEKHDCPSFNQNCPLDVLEVYNEFVNEFDKANEKYNEKRILMFGYAIKIGPDVHGKPAIELSDSSCGRCLALFVFENDDFYSKVKVGSKVVCRGNFLLAREPYGAVLKKSELVAVD